MKKLVLLLAVVFSVSLFSCGGAKTAQPAASDSDSVAADTVQTVDTAAADTVAADSVAK